MDLYELQVSSHQIISPELRVSILAKRFGLRQGEGKHTNDRVETYKGHQHAPTISSLKDIATSIRVCR